MLLPLGVLSTVYDVGVAISPGVGAIVSAVPALLLLRGGPRVIVINAPWYLQGDDEEDAAALTSVASTA